MLQSILSNLAIILLMHLFMSMLINFRKEVPTRIINISMTLLVSGAVIFIFYLPINFDGYLLDMRFIPLVFLSYIWGWKLGIPALIIVSTWRYFMGGEGVLLGIIFGMVIPTLLAAAFHRRSKLHGKHVERILLIASCWFICDFPIIFFIPNGLEIFKDIAFIRFFTFVGTALILYTFIALERQRRTLNEKLQKMAGEDSLTKLLNKRRFFEVMREKIHMGDTPFIAMLDIDHFKKLNDTYGHVIGDDILRRVGKILKKYEHDNFRIGRYGGEEFILFIGNSSFESATRMLEKIRLEISETCFTLEQGLTAKITVSIGMSRLDRESHILDSVHQADKFLYLAKKNGRNRLITSQDAALIKSS